MKPELKRPGAGRGSGTRSGHVGEVEQQPLVGLQFQVLQLERGVRLTARLGAEQQVNLGRQAGAGGCQWGSLAHVPKVEHYQETLVLVPPADVGEEVRPRGERVEVSVQQGALLAPLIAQLSEQAEEGAWVFALAL